MAAVNPPRRFRIELGFHNLAFLIRSPKPHLIWIHWRSSRNANKSRSAAKAEEEGVKTAQRQRRMSTARLPGDGLFDGTQVTEPL